MRTTKYVALLLALLLAVSLLPGVAEEEPITLQWYYVTDNDVTPLEDDWLQKELEEAYNVKLELVGRPGPDQNQWYQLEMAAGNEFDIYESGGLMLSDYAKYVENGLVLELDEEMIRANMPKLSAYYDAMSDCAGGNIFDLYRIDGKVYSIPMIRPGDGKRNVIGIRGDWLEELGLDVPHTIEEFEEVLDAFTYGDPDGNGIDDTYGFTGVNWNAFSMSPICQAFGTNIDCWVRNDEGKVVLGTVQPGMKSAIELLQKWYKAGYFPCEFWNQGWDEGRAQMTNGQCGMIVQAFDAFIDKEAGWALGELRLTNPDAWFEVVPGIVGPDGDYGCLQFTAVAWSGIMFNYKLGDDMDKVVKYMQVIDDIIFNEDWAAKAMYGPEGKGYTKDADGNFTFIKSEEPLTTPAGSYITEINGFFNDPVFERKMAGGDPEYVAKANAAYEMACGFYDLSSSVYLSRPVNAQYSSALGEIINNYMPQLISGERPLDDFDRMVEEWKAAGGDLITEEMQSILK